MKKHNEGYTLPLVMVVLLVLAIVAVTIMTTSLKNMQRQQSFIETMENQYDAQGEIEKVVAQLLSGTTIPVELLDEPPSFSQDKKSITGTITKQSENGNVTIACSIVISASTEIKMENSEYINPGSLTIGYTSYEIIKGGGG